MKKWYSAAKGDVEGYLLDEYDMVNCMIEAVTYDHVLSHWKAQNLKTEARFFTVVISKEGNKASISIYSSEFIKTWNRTCSTINPATLDFKHAELKKEVNSILDSQVWGYTLDPSTDEPGKWDLDFVQGQEHACTYTYQSEQDAAHDIKLLLSQKSSLVDVNGSGDD